MRQCLLLLLLIAGGCATSLGSTHTARTLPKGTVEATLHTGLLLPAGLLATVIGEGKDVFTEVARESADAGTVKIESPEAKRLFTVAAALVAGPPSPVQELAVRYGVHERVDVGLRYSGAAFSGEGHVQLYSDEAWAVAAGVSVGRHSFGGGLFGVLDKLDEYDFASFKRTDLGISFLAGKDWQFGSFHIGPKAVWSKYSSEGLYVDDKRIVVTTPNGEVLVDEPFDLASSLLVGGVIGGRVGYKYLWLSAELGVYGSRYRPTVLGEEVDLGGVVVYPTIGLAGRY